MMNVYATDTMRI